MTENNLVYLDTETTSLNTRLADTIEAAWAVNDEPIRSIIFPHTLEHADPEALRINGYYERGLERFAALGGYVSTPRLPDLRADFCRDLTGSTIVAENYGFDLAMLFRKLGFEPWHYRKIELSSVAMTVYDLDRPEGMSKTADRLRADGFAIPEGNHTAEADVDCLRACYRALRELRVATLAGLV